MKSRANCHKRFLTHQHGLSLIELMISIAIGLLLLAALSTLFVSQSRTRAELDKQNRMIDNGRYALDLLSENLRMAGFYAELDPASITVPASLPNPCSTTDADIGTGLPFHVQGYNAASPTAAISPVPSCVPSTLKTGSDILVTKRAFTTPIAAAAAAANTTYLQVSLCSKSTPGSTPPILENPYIVAKAPASFNLTSKFCTSPNNGPSADLRRFLVHIYFVDSNNKLGDGIPTLKMAELDATSNFVITPLVEGIEYFQVDYGIDTDNNGMPDGAYVSCASCTVDDWSKVVSVKINLISRNLDITSGYTDPNIYTLGTAGNVTPGQAYKRHAYTQVVRLINPAGRKE